MNVRTSLRPSLRSLPFLFACVLLLSSCSDGSGGDVANPNGPLTILSVGGELSADGPRTVKHPWTETFSGVVVCTDEPIVVTSVNYSGPTDPLDSYATLHWYLRRKAPTPRTVLSMRGSPGSNDPEWTTLGGRFERVSDPGVTVGPNCSSGRKVELLTTLVASESGADVTSIIIEYTSHEANYSLKVPYRYVACGQDITEFDRYC